MKISALFTSYTDARPHLMDGTIEVYATTRDHLVSCFGDIEIRRITPEMMGQWFTWMRNTRQMSLATARKHVRQARAMFKHAMTIGAYDRANPTSALKAAPVKNKDWDYVTPEQSQILLAVLPLDIARIVALCRWQGLRQGEAIRLRPGDVSWNTRRVRVRMPEGVEDETTKHRERVMPLLPETIPWLPRKFEPYTAGRGTLDKAVRRARDAAGLPAYRLLFHALRKSRETELMRLYAPAEVCMWFGNSLQVADDFYNGSSEDIMDRAAGVQPSVRDAVTQKISGCDEKTLARVLAYADALTRTQSGDVPGRIEVAKPRIRIGLVQVGTVPERLKGPDC